MIILAGSPVLAADANVEAARQHYAKAVQFYDLGRFQEAIGEFEAAYAAKPDPALLYNLAQSARRLGDNKRAIDLYKNFLMHVPGTPKRAEVERRIEELQALVNQAAPSQPQPPPGAALANPAFPSPAAGPVVVAAAAPAAPPTNPSEAQGPRTLRIVGLSVAGVGAVGIVGGVVFGLRARSLGNQVSNAPVFVASDEQAGKNSEVLQWVCYGLGAAALATGSVLFYLGGRASAPPRVAVAPMLLPAGAGLATGGTF